MKKYLLILCISFTLMSCNKEEQKQEEQILTTTSSSILKLTDAQLKNFEISTTSFQTQNLPTTIRLNAKTAVTPENTISITNAFGGYVKRIALIPGNYVNKGQILVVLEDPQYIQMQEDYLTTKVLLEQANADYVRQKELNAEQAASDKVMQQAKATRQSLMVKKSSLEQKLRIMNINPATVSLNNIRRTINVYAPISGMVSQVFTNTGQYVSPADPMLEIINPNRALLNVKVFEKDLSTIHIGQLVTAYTNAKPDQKLDAQISSISNQVNEDGTVDVFAKITNANGTRLTANMYFNIELHVNSLTANVLPEEAVVQFEGKDYIFEQQNKNQFRLIPVTTGGSANKMIEIKSPQNSGKVYVAKGAYHLLTAMKNSDEEG
ncbi:efflux RND transporter periplasmic adaptor subunit [Empedobacter brevis]|uniref:efflux RND transporter periplasmic adaptor subunit n=1 Tax=Empedobacter brevis TaxID=247 RepID=UPI00123E1A01|nr:efflux RND transporter periplasmic adaptor subunit [Empedobacter brevis]QES91620.1 efflux RND transporter periplasmic adaptor subunit [Empedobacter brevis]